MTKAQNKPTRAGWQFDLEGIDALQENLQLLKERVATVSETEYQMVAAFKEMEADIFKNEGKSSTWGYNGHWAALSAKTIANKGGYSDILLDTGALEKAASVNPAVKYLGKGGAQVDIDPRTNNPDAEKNYGAFHQQSNDMIVLTRGGTVLPKRAFVPDPPTPVFLAVLRLIVHKHIFGEKATLRQKGGTQAENIVKNIKKRKAYRDAKGIENKSGRRSQPI